jgi:hypothetical protein
MEELSPRGTGGAPLRFDCLFCVDQDGEFRRAEFPGLQHIATFPARFVDQHRHALVDHLRQLGITAAGGEQRDLISKVFTFCYFFSGHCPNIWHNHYSHQLTKLIMLVIIT